MHPHADNDLVIETPDEQVVIPLDNCSYTVDQVLATVYELTKNGQQVIVTLQGAPVVVERVDEGQLSISVPQCASM
jgi:hypothetical protein